MWKVINVTDGTVEEIAEIDRAVWPGSILAVETELYEVLCAEEGCVYVTDTTHPRN